MNKKIWILIGVIILVILAIGIFKSKTPKITDNTPIKIGAALALTGDASTWG